MDCRISVVGVALLFTGCMISPYDGDPVDVRRDEVSFGGWLNNPGREIALQIYDHENSAWVTFDTTISDNSVDPLLGSPWHYWQDSAALPRAGKFWPSSQSGSARVRAYESQIGLYTGTEDMWACVIGEVTNAGKTPTTAYQDCSVTYGASQEVTLLGECDVSIYGGCFDTLTAVTLNDYPYKKSYDFSEKLQGITHDEYGWYLTNEEGDGMFARVPKHGSMDTEPIIIVTNPFPGWTHPGDIDYSDGWIYVALETQDGSAGNNAIGVIPTSHYNDKSKYLTFSITSGPQQTGGSFPWIARDPFSGYFYSSTFTNSGVLQRYKAAYDSTGKPVSFQHCGEMDVSAPLDRV